MKRKYSIKQVEEFLEQSNAIESEYSPDALNDAKEAWDYLMSTDDVEPIVIIKKVHFLLAKNLNPRIAGKIRECSVFVGSQICPPPYAIEALLSGWIQGYWDAKTVNSIKNAHIQFERIHPFEDFNGRTGRILMNYQRVKADLPLLIIHTGKEQMGYYKWFKVHKEIKKKHYLGL